MSSRPAPAEFVCKECGFRRLRSLTYYRDNDLCGFCGHLIEYGKPAEKIKDLVPITRLITRVDIEK